MAAPTTVLTIIKDMTYRNVAGEEWSNTYALSGTTPADATAWKALFDALVLEEKKLYGSGTRVVGGYGYDKIPDKGDHAIWSVDMRVAPNTPPTGTLTSDGQIMQGDAAGWVRWSLNRFNSRGKRVYLRKYFHGGQITSGTPDSLSSNYTAALAAFATKMDNGSLAGSRKLVDKDGNEPIAHGISSFATTRTLKRRGKRPPT